MADACPLSRVYACFGTPEELMDSICSYRPAKSAPLRGVDANRFSLQLFATTRYRASRAIRFDAGPAAMIFVQLLLAVAAAAAPAISAERGEDVAVLAENATVPAAATATSAQAGDATPRSKAERLEQRIHALGRFGANPAGGVSRVAFSDADIDGRDYITALMRGAGLEVRIDAAGNIIGRRAGTDPALPVIMTGSHIDSVPQGGNYDGDVGVLGAIEVAELLREHGIATRHPFEFVVFTDEEGGVVGSQAMAGRVGPNTLDVVSHSGLTIGDGIRKV